MPHLPHPLLPNLRSRSAYGSVLLAPLLLANCAGVGVFLTDTHGPSYRVNAPLANSETSRRVEGKGVAIDPLQAQAGNIWPGPVQPEPTLEDLQKEPVKPLPDLTGSTPPSISNVPNLIVPLIPHHLQPHPGEDSGVLNGPLPSTLGTPGSPSFGGGTPPGVSISPDSPDTTTGPNRPTASPQGTITPTQKGAAVGTANPSGLGQANPTGAPAGTLGITVPNGDGTSTVIAPDGSIKTIPTPK